MNSQIKSLVDPVLYNTFLDVAKDDIILQSVLKKTENLKEFTNALLAAIICITDREISFQNTVKQLLESVPQVQEILKVKSELIEPNHDTSLLPPEKDT